MHTKAQAAVSAVRRMAPACFGSVRARPMWMRLLTPHRLIIQHFAFTAGFSCTHVGARSFISTQARAPASAQARTPSRFKGHDLRCAPSAHCPARSSPDVLHAPARCRAACPDCARALRGSGGRSGPKRPPIFRTTHAHTHTRTHARAHAHAHRHTQIQGKPGTGGPASITCAANRRAPCARELTPAGKLLTTKFVQSFVSHIIPLTRRRRPMLPSIAVAGGGPAGLMVALLLSRQGLRCAA